MADPRITRTTGDTGSRQDFLRSGIHVSDDAFASASSDSSDESPQYAAPRLHAAIRATAPLPAPDRRGLRWQPDVVTPPALVRRETLLEALMRQDRDGLPPLVAALIDADYDLALALLAHGASAGLQTEYARHGARHGVPDPGTSAMTLLALHPFPLDLLRAFLAEAAQHAPYQLDRPDGTNATALGIAVGSGDCA